MYKKIICFLGKTRNCCRLAYVTNKITYAVVRAVYHVCEQKDEDLWYYPKIVPVKILKENVLFKEEFICHKVIPKIIRTGMRY